MKKIKFLIIAVILVGCNCEYKLNRVLKKCPELLAKDTIKTIDTITVNGIQSDTIFKHYYHDTVIMHKGQLTVKYFYNTKDSTVYLYGKCDTIKQIIVKKIPYEKIINASRINKIALKYLTGLLVTSIILLIIIKTIDYNGKQN